MNRITNTITPFTTVIRLLGVVQNPANGFPARPLGQANSGNGASLGPYQGNQFKVATPFTTGLNVLGYHPTGAQLHLNRFEAVSPTLDVSIRGDNAGTPSDTVLSSLTTTMELTEDDHLITFTTSDEITLQPNTKYWLYISATGTRAVVLDTESDKEDTQSQADWSIGNTGVKRTDVEPWSTATNSRVLRMSILGHGISPDPNDGTSSGDTESVSEPAGGDLAADDTTIGRLVLNDRVTGRHHAGTLNVDPPIYDVDWFAFTAEANTDYQFTANQGQRYAKLNVLRIFNDEGVEQRNSLIKGDVETSPGRVTTSYFAVDRLNNIAFRTHTAGTYYVSIEAWHGNGSTIAYTLTMFDDDYSDDMDTTATVTVDESGRNFEDFQNYLMRTDASPESQTTDDVDWIRVALEAGATYEIVYDVACQHRSIIEGIYDSDGNRVFDTLERKEVRTRSGITVNMCTDLVTKFTPESDGDHYIAVSAKAPTVVTYRDGRAIYTNYPFQGVQGTLSITLTSPPSTAATGAPLIRGERKVGSTLTGDTTRIADISGLTNPVFEYQWQRVDDGARTDVPGALSETYTLTDDDVGKRMQLQVQFNDDEGTEEMRTGPATSVITKVPHLLVGNLTKNVRGVVPNREVQSTGFNTGTHEFGYAIDAITAHRATTTPLGDGEAEIRIYGSTENDVVINRRPLASDLVVTASDLIQVNGEVLNYSARSRARLEPSTTYHYFVAALDGSGPHSCVVAGNTGHDSGSLPGFSINRRSYSVHASSLLSFAEINFACGVSLRGAELQSSNFLQHLEFTSTPTQHLIYMTGEVIEVTATLNQAVTFDGPPPVLLLQIGNNQREMTYVASASTGSSWVFRYTVTADDRDDDGISFDRFALRGYADADLSNPPTRDDREHYVNAAPQIVSRRVSSKPIAPTWYGPGEKIQFTLGFSLPVAVVGDPQLEFSITTPGPQNEFASYLSGSSTTTDLMFSYTVLAVDDDDDGIWWNADSLRLDSDDSITGTINGLDADLDHTALNNLKNHRIDQNPRAVSQEVTSDPMDGTNSDTYGAGDAITFEVVFNQPVTVNGAPRLRFSITGPGDEFATYVSGNGTNTLVFSYTVLATEMDPDGIYLYKNPLDYQDTNADSIVGTSNNLSRVPGSGVKELV